MKKIVVLGGGYGGLEIVNQLSKDQIGETEIVLVDRVPYHAFKTEFYAVAAGTVADTDIRVRFPEKSNIKVVVDEIQKIDLENKQVELAGSSLSYDHLVIGIGCEDNYHEIEGASEHSLSIQTIGKARKAYEQLQNLKAYGSVTLIGSGLSGVEMAAELRESRNDLNIRILDRGESVLNGFPEKLQKYVEANLKAHDIDIIHQSHIDYLEDGVVCNEGNCLVTDATIWTGGIKPSSLLDDLAVAKDRSGRIVLNHLYQIPGFEEVYVVGDCAALPYPPSAQIAKQQGRQIAKVLKAVLRGEERPEIGSIAVKGVMGSLGKKTGFGTANGLSLTGSFPRLIKSGILWVHKFHTH